MFKGFKDFLMRGNVIDLSVAVVMGTAFTAVVSSVTKGIVQPLLAIFGGNSQLGLGFQMVKGKPATFIAIGPIVSAAVDFVMVAAVLYFLLILPMNTFKKRFTKAKKADPTQTELLTEIRDLLAAQAGVDGSELSESSTLPDSSATSGSSALSDGAGKRRVRASSLAE